MLEVIPIQTKIEQEAICARCGVPYNADYMAYQAVIDGTLKGICQFSMDSTGGHIHNLALVTEGDINTLDRVESLFVMGRATLNFIDLCGVHVAFFDDALFPDEGMIRSIGFARNQDGRWEMNLTDFFAHPCQHGHAE